ncbi:uncharacterized protein N7511_000859 [Penicillium nucicola]|uniref:uncharacterized protein n=1 Tax=Penicillium nucicola TaxID=1850975 RepID=UPI0025456DCE|nr:uncharacterized protein N7511_000859 [Penicillium nucicola]KAJ5775848.1 hypothetical protein N7511_000859 [Penicillium nucicola]
MMYFVEGIATANKTKVGERLPWVFNGWSLPRSIEVDSMLDEWLICGIKVTWNTNSSQTLDVWRVSDVKPSVDGDNEVDLHIGLWVEREVLEQMAPSLLESRCFENIQSMGKLIQFEDPITDFNKLPLSKREAGMKSAGHKKKQAMQSSKPLRRSVKSKKLQARK